MYMVGIEDRDYKEDKVECKSYKFYFIKNIFIYFKGGQLSMDII